MPLITILIANILIKNILLTKNRAMWWWTCFSASFGLRDSAEDARDKKGVSLTLYALFLTALTVTSKKN
jgi:hypothetical protein